MKQETIHLKHFLIKPILLMILAVITTLFLVSNVHAVVSLADGTYTIDYLIKQAKDDSVSIANDYFEKPATLFVKDGLLTMQIELNHSDWTTEFKVPDNNGEYKDVQVISRDETANTRIVQFNLKDLSTPLASKMHVTVPDINYSHDYTVRFDFDTNSIAAVKGMDSGRAIENKQNTAIQSSTISKSDVKTDSQGTALTANPQTGDTANMMLLIGMLVISVTFLVYRFKLISR